MSKVLEPVILMKITTDDGDIKDFEVPLSKFHQLRYTVADLLHRMKEIRSTHEKKPV